MTALETSPAEHSLRLAVSASKKVRGRDALIGATFIRSPRATANSGDDAPTPGIAPLAGLIRGGGARGGMRLSLYLSLQWLAGGGRVGEHRTSPPARALAGLVGLDDPDTHGSRRVRDALAAFEDAQLVTLTHVHGKPTTVTLLADDGTGTPYVRPNKYWDERKEDDEKFDPDRVYIRLPSEFWTQGWIHELKPAAIAILLVLLLVTRNGTKASQWVSMSDRKLYGLSDDTWTRGTRELKRHEILHIGRTPVSSNDFEQRRYRNTYTIHYARLQDDARSDPPPAEPMTRRRPPKKKVAPRRGQTARKTSPRAASPS